MKTQSNKRVGACRRVGGYNLVPVAVDRDVLSLAPVSRSFVGPDDTKHTLFVEVRVTREGGVVPGETADAAL